jgi:membrane-associated phospholipid phosphatase
MQDNQPIASPNWDWNTKWVRIIIIGLVIAGIGSLWIDIFVASRQMDGIPGDIRGVVRLSEIFAHGFGLIVIVLVLWTVTPRFRRMMPRLVACVVLPGLVVQSIKLLIARKRPKSFGTDMANSVGETWIGLSPNWEIGNRHAIQSFPSGHAATAFGLAIGLSWLFPRGRYVFFVLALLASFQRIESGAHWVSDVIAGACVAIGICFVIFRQGSLGKAFCRLERVPMEQSQNPSSANDQQQLSSKTAA